VIARRVLDLGRITIGDGDDAVVVEVTLGITVANDAGDSPVTLVERADAAAQLAKRGGTRWHEAP
jgi:GGDEF domain-containing protein